MQCGRSDGEQESCAEGAEDDRKNPERCGSDVHERLEPLSFEAVAEYLAQRLGVEFFDEVWEVGDGVPENGNCSEGGNSAEDSRPRNAAIDFESSEEGESEGKSCCEQKLGHDRVGEAAVVIGVTQQSWAEFEAAVEIDEQHAEHREAAKLVE